MIGNRDDPPEPYAPPLHRIGHVLRATPVHHLPTMRHRLPDTSRHFVCQGGCAR